MCSGCRSGLYLLPIDAWKSAAHLSPRLKDLGFILKYKAYNSIGNFCKGLIWESMESF